MPNINSTLPFNTVASIRMTNGAAFQALGQVSDLSPAASVDGENLTVSIDVGFDLGYALIVETSSVLDSIL